MSRPVQLNPCYVNCRVVLPYGLNFLYRLPDVGIGRHRAILAEP